MWREAAEWWQNYEGQSPLEYCIDDAIIEMHQSLHQRRCSLPFKKRVCLEWRDKITPHKVSRSASAHYRRSIKQWHHWSSSGVEDKRDPIRKTCDSINISYRNDPEQVFSWKSFLCNILQISSINHTKQPIPSRYPHQRTSWVTTPSHPSPHRNLTDFISFHFNRKVLLSLTLQVITIRFGKTTRCCSAATAATYFDAVSLYLISRLSASIKVVAIDDRRSTIYRYRHHDLSVVLDHALSFGDRTALDAQHCRQRDSTADHDHDAHFGNINGTALQHEESCAMLLQCAMVRLRCWKVYGFLRVKMKVADSLLVVNMWARKDLDVDL